MEEVNIASEIASHSVDFSFFTLFLRADWVVKSVIIILILASIYSWNIIISKIIRINRLKKLDEEFDEIFWSGNSFNDLYETFNYNQSDPKSKIFCSAIAEWKKTNADTKNLKSEELNSLKERMLRTMQVTFNKESENIEKNLTFLATAGSTAPFIGLFGTVWGIMNSFQSIAIAQNTSLAVVAPGIAEALFATALGLVAAIHAVLAYNKITDRINTFGNRIEIFINEMMIIISKEVFKD